TGCGEEAPVKGSGGLRGLRVVTIIYWTAGWLVGIWTGSYLDLPTPLWAALGVLGLITAVIFKKHPRPLAMSIALAAAALGAAAARAKLIARGRRCILKITDVIRPNTPRAAHSGVGKSR
ncbi:MAG: hypothetical protein P8169_05290, partial [Chloroflexota bacterium]